MLNAEQIKKAKELASEVLTEIMFSANKESFQENDLVIIGEIVALHTNDSDTQELLIQHKKLFEKLAGLLHLLEEKEAFELADELGKLVYRDTWQIQIPETNIIDNNLPNKIMLYKAKNGELCLRFQDPTKAREFLKQVKQGVIPSAFRQGIQYKDNPTGITPFQYSSQPNQLFCPSYQARNGEFAINLGSEQVAEQLIKNLKLSITAKKNLTNGEIKITYGNDLFSSYKFANGRTHSQAGTIYFNQKNELFKTPGTYLQINLTTGELKQDCIKDYTPALSPRQEFLLNSTVNNALNDEDDNNVNYIKNSCVFFAPQADKPLICNQISAMIDKLFGDNNNLKGIRLDNGQLIINFSNDVNAKLFYENFKIQFKSVSENNGQITFTDNKEIQELISLVNQAAIPENGLKM